MSLRALRSEHAARISVFALIGLVSALVVSSQLRASPATTIAPDYSDLVLSMTFDNDSGSTVTDSSKYQHHGAANGTAITDGKFGNGRSFNGTSDSIVIPHADALSPTGALTVEAWVYLDTVSTSMKIVRKRGVFSDTAGGYMLGAWFGNPRGYGFEVYDNNQHLVNTTPERLPTTQTWTHVVGTFDGTNLRIYENGQLVGTTAWSGAIMRSTKDLWIGMQPDNSLMPFRGKMDEIRIYNRALSAEEIACSYEGKVWVSGSCAQAGSRPPAIASVSGPSSFEEGTSGTWTVKGYDPDGESLTFRVTWGDGSPEETAASTAGNVTTHTQTFTHTYRTAGTFSPSFSVANDDGTSPTASTALTVTAPVTRVSGGIYEPTTWTKARSPYVVADDITVFPGVTLTVEPGVEVRAADGKRIVIRGSIVAEGTEAQRITFTADRSSPSKGAWGGIQIQNQQGGKASVKYADVRYAQSALSVECCWSGGPVTIADSTFRDNAIALGGYAGWKVRVDRATFENNTNAVTSADKDIYDSTFRNNTYGISQTERTSVYRSTFTGHTVAAWGGRGTFTQNTVTGNETGVQANYEGWTTTFNTITGNGVGIIVGQYDSTTPEIAYNNIHGNTTYDLKVTGASNKTAANNWWGTTDASAIDAKVVDGRDHTALGLLTYQPVRTQAVDITNPVVPDTQAPGLPTNVTAEEIATTSTRIAWLAPSDNVGVTSYEVRYRRGTSFADVDWASASSAGTIPSTVTAGQRVSTVLSGLTANTDYGYGVGVKACDAANNCSTIAAVAFRTQAVSGTTVTTNTTTGTGTGTTGSDTTTTATGTSTTITTSTETTTTSTGTTTNTGTGTGMTTTGTSGSGGGGGGGGATTTVTTTGTATLRVTVRDAAGQVVSGAFVGLSHPGGVIAAPSATTGVDGVGTFSSVAAGSYALGVSPPASRADLGSIANQPVALALSSTTDVGVVLPVRTTNAATGATAAAATLCGTVIDPDRNILSGITIGLTQSGSGTALLGTSTVTGADGRYCFPTLVPGTYIVGAMTPAHRTDLAPPGTVVVSLAGGTAGNQDLAFGRAAVAVGPGVPFLPPSTVATPLPAIERCVRDAFGLDLYERIRSGRAKPKPEEYERARHCFTLAVIADNRPTETPIGAPTIPMPSFIVIPGPAVPPPTAQPPEFDDRCEARVLPGVKRGLPRIGRELTTIEREIDRLRTTKVTMPTDTGLLIVRTRDLLTQVRAATTCADAFTVGEELPDLVQQLRTSVERVSRLRFAPRVLASFDREVKRFLDRVRVSIRRLERAKFAAAEFAARRAEAEQQLKDCRASGADALAAVDPELFEDTLRSCFEILDEARELLSLTDALANARSFLSGTVGVTLRKADRIARELTRAKKDAAEVQQFATTLRQQRDEALTAVRAGGLAKEELVDLLEGVTAAFGDLDDAFERALGTSTYEEVVGKAPPPTIAAPKLEKPTEEFFERE